MDLNKEDTVKLSEFEESVIAISSVDGVPENVIVFHNGKLIGASLTDDVRGGFPICTDRKIGMPGNASMVQAPKGMKAKIVETESTKDIARDLRLSRVSVTKYEVVKLEL
ncbi:MAG: hypothetical protein WC067_00375 [Candidatus Methanomethylophilaceae archaeon]